jgi:hypothetical protein
MSTDEEYVDAVAVAAVATDIVVAATEITTNAGSDSSDEVCTTCILAKNDTIYSVLLLFHPYVAWCKYHNDRYDGGNFAVSL